MSQGNSYNDLLEFRVRITPADLVAVQQQVAGAATAGLAQALAGRGGRGGGAPSSGQQLAQIRAAATGGASGPSAPGMRDFAAAVNRFVAAVNRFASAGGGGRGGTGGGSRLSAAAQARADRQARTGFGLSPLYRAQARRRNLEEDRALRQQQRDERNQPQGFLGRAARGLFGRYGSISPAGRMLGLRRGGQITEVLRSMSRGGRGGFAAAGAAVGAMGGGVAGAGAGALAGAAGGPVGLALTVAIVGLQKFASALNAVTNKLGQYNSSTAGAMARNQVQGVLTDIKMSAAMAPVMTEWVNFKTELYSKLGDLVVALKPLWKFLGEAIKIMSDILAACLDIGGIARAAASVFGIKVPGKGAKKPEDKSPDQIIWDHLTGIMQDRNAYDPAKYPRAHANTAKAWWKTAAQPGIGLGASAGPISHPGAAGNFGARMHGVLPPRFVGGGHASNGGGLGPMGGRGPGGIAIPNVLHGGHAGGGMIFTGSGGRGGYGGGGENHRHFDLPAFRSLFEFASHFRHGASALLYSGHHVSLPKGGVLKRPGPVAGNGGGVLGQEGIWRAIEGALGGGAAGTAAGAGLNSLIGGIKSIAETFTSMPPINPQLTVEQQFTYQLQNEQQVHASMLAFRDHLDAAFQRVGDEVKLRIGYADAGLLTRGV